MIRDLLLSHLVRTFWLVALLMGLAGCTTLEPPPLIAPQLRYPVGSSPVFLLTYFPYGPCMQRHLGAPIPNYRSWTEERMERDIDRLSALGIDVILLCVDVADLTDEFRQERIQRFMVMLGGLEGGPKLALFVRSAAYENSLIRDTLSDAVQWLVASGVTGGPGYWKMGGRGLVVIGDGLDAGTVGHPALTLRGTAGPGAVWHWPTPSTSFRPGLSRDGSQTRVAAALAPAKAAPDGHVSDSVWPVSRGGGRSLLQALWGAFDEQARYVCVSSWNDFVRGDFIEPNSRDGQGLYQTLRKEIARVRLHCSGTQTPAPAQ